MARIIAFAGAGGKSSYIESLAENYASEGLKVCITTTTHIYNFPDRQNISYRGRLDGVKLAYPGDEHFNEICGSYDIVLVEADGSLHRPLKIPSEHEPVIPGNVNEIVIIMGLHSIGRRLSEVCQRFDLSGEPDSLVSLQVIDRLAAKYYLEPLKSKFPYAAIRYFRSDLLAALRHHHGKRVALVLMASGSSRSFGSNKLMHRIHGKELYRYGLGALTHAANLLLLDGISSEVFVTVRSPDSIMRDGAELLVNSQHSEGIAASIRLGTEAAIRGNFDAVLFLAGDMPFFPADDVAELVRESLCSGKDFGCAYHYYPSNPAVFSSKVFPELMSLSGDEGAMKLIRRHSERTHYYIVSSEKLTDIDTMHDAEMLADWINASPESPHLPKS